MDGIRTGFGGRSPRSCQMKVYRVVRGIELFEIKHMD